MLFVVTATDKPNSLPVRKAARAAHFEYLKGFEDKIVLAGPFLAEDGETSCGSMIVIEMPDRKAAEEFSAGDPFAKAGLFAETSIRLFRLGRR